MNAFTLLSVLVSLSSQPQSASAAPRLIQGSYDMVVCMQEGNLNVRGDNLNRILFSVPNHEPLKVFQGWGENKKTKRIDGRSYNFVKVQFPRKEDNDYQGIGWVAEQLVKPKAECAGAGGNDEDEGDQDQRPSLPQPPVKPGKPGKPGQPPVTPRPPQDDAPGIGNGGGLSDPNCCQFPTKEEPTEAFDSGMRRFGAGRSGGDRLHAACDLYRYLGEPISAVSNGSIIRDKYFFYQGTYAIEVRHSGGFVVRYGEVTGKSAPSAAAGNKVRGGQTVAYMGKVNSNCCEPMLHFELFSGSRSGSLSGGGPYQRRSDLLNPTQYLRHWEENTFRSRK